MKNCLDYINEDMKEKLLKEHEFEYANHTVLACVLGWGNLLNKGIRSYEEVEEILGIEETSKLVNKVIKDTIPSKDIWKNLANIYLMKN